MHKFIIQGGQLLRGKVKVAGAKNSALKLMAASLLTDQPTTLENVPRITDVLTMAAVLNRLGVDVSFEDPDKVYIEPGANPSCEAPYDLVSRMRASIMVLGPLLARLGRARVAMPGGCKIGTRKIDLHIKGLEMMGAKIEVGHGFIEATSERLVGNVVPLDYPSVGATENLLMSAVLAEGTTIIENAAREPEIIDLGDFLTQMGAQIEGLGTSTIRIDGVETLGGTTHAVIPDRIEAGTFLIAGAMTRGDVTVEGLDARHLGIFLAKLKDIGAVVETTHDSIRVKAGSLKAVDISTLPYPGFPTDLQAPLMSLLAVAKGVSVITENIFDNRFAFAQELGRMGADIRIDGHQAVIRGVPRLTGTSVQAPDLRGGAALVLAGLAAEGVTEITDIDHIDRGYQDLESKLGLLGASVERVAALPFPAKAVLN